jgi:23S rRNA (uracil747-C5)-methyltransferase
MINRAESQGILRFVLRSTEAVPRIKKLLDRLRSQHHWLTVVSCNIQPLHAAIPEGPQEIVLSEESSIEESFNQVPLLFSPQSFMQVTPEIAERLYGRAGLFTGESCRDASVLDLFCGVGGFSFSIAPHVKRVVGVELSESAIKSATLTAQRLGHTHTEFHTANVDDYIQSTKVGEPNLIVANPPRRGLSPIVKQRILALSPSYFLYSSCNPETFARDAAEISQGYVLDIVAPFDMFPLTEHCEVLGIFKRL